MSIENVQDKPVKTNTLQSIVRKTVLTVMITAYSLSALMGIIAILSVNMDWRIIGTTALIGTASLVILCALTLSNIKYWNILGVITGALSIAATILTLLFLWEVIKYPSYMPDVTQDYTFYESLLKTNGLLWIYTVTGAFSSLLIAVSHNLTKIIKLFAYITIALGVLSALLVTLIIVDSDSLANYEVLARFIAILLILTTLGMLITLTMALVQKVINKTTTSFQNFPTELTSQSLESLKSYAEWRNMDVNSYVAYLLQQEAQNGNSNQKGYLE